MIKNFRFSLRTAMVGVMLISIVFTFGAMYGPLGMLLSLTILVGLFVAGVVRSHMARYSLLLIVLIAFSFLAIHREFRGSQCPVCKYSIKQFTYLEILRIPLIVELERGLTLTTLISNDFGCPCQHEQMKTLVVEDYWGLYYCLNPVYPSPSFYGEDKKWEEWYRQVVSPVIQDIRHERPDLAKDFCERVIKQGDEGYYLHTLYDKIFADPRLKDIDYEEWLNAADE